jgi:hypothetical protein
MVPRRTAHDPLECEESSNTTSQPSRYHAVAEVGVAAREIAEAVGLGLKIPVVSMSPQEAAGHFGWLGFFAGRGMPVSSALTQQWPGWRPTQKESEADGSKNHPAAMVWMLGRLLEHITAFSSASISK